MSDGDAAVVVGNAHYEHLTPLDHADANAERVAGWLVEDREVPKERVHVVHDGTREDIAAALRAAAGEVQPGGTMWVYFSGRATTEGALLAVDARPEPPRIGDGSVHVAELPPPGSRTFAMAVIVDACADDLYAPGADVGSEALVPRGPFAIWASFAHGSCVGPARAGGGAFTRAVLMRLGGDGVVEGAPPKPRRSRPVRPDGHATAFFLVEPPGTTVSVDGDPVCAAPCVAWIAEGPHRIGLSDARGAGERDVVVVDAVVVRERFDWRRDPDPNPEHALRIDAIAALQRVWDDAPKDGLGMPLYGDDLSPEAEYRLADLMLDEWRAHRGTPLGDQWFEEARSRLARLSRWSSASPVGVFAANREGVILWEAGRSADALARWDELTAIQDGRGAYARIMLAFAATQRGDVEAARLHLAAAAGTPTDFGAFARRVSELRASGAADPFAAALAEADAVCGDRPWLAPGCGVTLARISLDLEVLAGTSPSD